MPWLPGDKDSRWDPSLEPADPDNVDYDALWDRAYSNYFMSKAIKNHYLADSALDMFQELALKVWTKIPEKWPMYVQYQRDKGLRISFQAFINRFLGWAAADIARKTKTEFGKAYEFERERPASQGEEGEAATPAIPASQVSFRSIDAPIAYDDEGGERTLKDTLEAPGTGAHEERLEREQEREMFMRRFMQALEGEDEFTRDILFKAVEIMLEGPSSTQELESFDAHDAEETTKYEVSIKAAEEADLLGNPVPPIYRPQMVKRPLWNKTNIEKRIGRETGQSSAKIQRLLRTNPKIQELLGRPGGIPEEHERPLPEFDPENSVIVLPNKKTLVLEDYAPADRGEEDKPSGVPV